MNCGKFDIICFGVFSEEFRIMNMLCFRDDFLIVNEDIKRVGVVRIVRRRYCVKWSGVEGILCEYVEVCVVFFFY